MNEKSIFTPFGFCKAVLDFLWDKELLFEKSFPGKFKKGLCKSFS